MHSLTQSLDKVVCVGMNYRDHCLEQSAPIPTEPIIFSKFPSSITGPYDDIHLPNKSQSFSVLRAHRQHEETSRFSKPSHIFIICQHRGSDFL
ncbi:fumarylacetoacetate hydrolase domain-containing protein 2A [Ictalurus furcatus]|uniref:fumarylacetoacetate hydrolase domain-containing protein 2A n=1 Tax=Ictalurus furcatus TaxID=66913 RepID=UPI00235085FF|nr:fumarylacetoacetate hydrolase domain-containing protein 2A [Ictalurus furcatus]